MKVLLAVIGAAVGAAVRPLFSEVIYPWFVEFFREPTKLADEFKGTLNFSNGSVETISVRPIKRGYGITGKLRFKGADYFIRGRYSHGLLTFHYSPESKAKTSQGSGAFKRLKDGELFQGHFVYFSQEDDKTDTVSCDLNAA